MNNSAIKFQKYRREQGFVLVLTLSIIAIGLLASSYIARWIDQEVENSSKLASSAQQTIDNFSTLSTIIYVASTHPVTYAGIAFPQRQNLGYGLPVDENGDPIVEMQGNELRLDNRLYQGIGNSLFQLQDESGLISVNTLSKDRLKSLFAIAGISQSHVPSALAKLQDYIDNDSEYRPNGAEYKQYRKALVSGPGNHRLRSPEELSAVLGWTSIMSNQQFEKIAYLLTSLPVVPLNINSAPKENLLILGLSPQEVQNVITFRESQSINFANIRSLLPSTISLPDTDIFQYYASRSLRVNILSSSLDKVDEYHIKLTPQVESGKPWHIRYKKTRFIPPVNRLQQAISTGKAIFSED